MTVKEALNILIIHGKNNVSILEGNENHWIVVTDEEKAKVSGEFQVAVDTVRRLVEKTDKFLHETKGFEVTG